MLSDDLKRFLSKLPPRMQQELKRLRFRRQVRAGTFVTDEPEYERLGEWVTEGGWVIDVGANVGHYTLRLSRLVGRGGRVLAFEPVPETFELLAANIAAAGARNVSLFNAALSANAGTLGIAIPRFSSGLANYYMANLTSTEGAFDVLTISLDDMIPPRRISFVKIDVEGHEIFVLRGMERLLRRDRPHLVVEGTTDDVRVFLQDLGYHRTRLPGSPNSIFSPIDERRSS